MNSRLPVVAAALIACLAACRVDDNATIQPAGICAFPEEADECAMPEECERVYTGRNVYLSPILTDGTKLFTNSLQLWLQFRNQLPDNSDGATSVNTNNALVEGYKVSFEAPGLTIDSQRIDNLSQEIPAGETTVVAIDVIPVETSQELADEMAIAGITSVEILSKVRLFGRFVDDFRTFETGDVRIPVMVFGTPFDFTTFNPCPAGQELEAVCPNFGQTASFTCVDPEGAGTTP